MKYVKRKKRQISIQKVPEYICSLYVLVLITVYMLSFSQGGYTTISEHKCRFFLWLSSIFVISMTLILVEFWLIQLPAPDKGRTILHNKIIPVCLFMYLLFSCLSGFLSEYPQALLGGERHEGMLTIALYVLSTLLLMWKFQPGRWMLPIFSLSILLFCGLGIIQLTGDNPFYLYPVGYNFYDAGIYYSGQYWSTIGNTNICSALLSVSSGVFAVAMIRKSSIVNGLYMLSMCLSIFSILELNAEAGIVAVMVGLLCMLPIVVINWQMFCNTLKVFSGLSLAIATSFAAEFYDGGLKWVFGKETAVLVMISLFVGIAGLTLQKSKSFSVISSQRLRTVLAMSVISLIVSGLFILYFCEDLPVDFLNQAHELMHGNWNDEFGSHRIYIWKQVWELVWEAPLLGGGPDTLGQRGLIGFSRYSNELKRLITSSIDVAHNEYLNILVNQGLLSLLPYLAAIGFSLYVWWKNADDDVVCIGGAALLFYCIHAFFGISMCMSAPCFWIALAVLNIKTNKKERER